MPRYEPWDCHALMLPVVFSEQIVPGCFAFSLDYLVDHELDLKALDSRFKNDTPRRRRLLPADDAKDRLARLQPSQGLI